MFYATYNTSGQSSTLESTTYYYYNDLGNVTRVVTDKENTGRHRLRKGKGDRAKKPAKGGRFHEMSS